MQGSIVFLLVLASGVSANKATPIQKIITMMTDMSAKGKKEKQDEQVRFATYKQFCESTSGEKNRAITSGKESIEQLQASIALAKSDAEVATEQIAGHDADVNQWTTEVSTNKDARAKQHAAFEEIHTDLSESVDACQRALTMLKKEPATVAQSLAQESSVMSLLQIPKGAHASHARKSIMSFLQRIDPARALLQEAEDEGITVEGPQANAFESSSGGVIDLVDKLGDRFQDERMAAEKGEENQRNAYQMMQADLKAQISNAQDARSNKASTKAQRLEDRAQGKGDLADTQAALAEDEKYLADLTSECQTKEFDYENRQEMRQGEIDAVGKAIEIMSSGDVSGAGDKHLPGLIQKKTALAQLRSSVRSPQQDAVVEFLQDRAGKTGSKMLALLAQRAASDPFTKVNKLIRDMIQKLTEEANEDATHEGFCDTEMGTNKQTRDAKTEAAEKLSAQIEGLTADIAKCASEATDLGNQIVAIDGAVATATADRNEEKAKNQETIQDSTVANEAVGQALQLLKDYYAKAGEPIEQPAPQQGAIQWDDRALQILSNAKGGASLAQAQARVPGAPEMEEGQYSGMANGGVLGLMEVVQSDFSKVIAETNASEAEAAKAYSQFMADSSQDKAVKSTEQTHKQHEGQRKSSALATAQKDLRITQDELHAAMEYYEKLKPSCEEKVVTYAEKVAARNAEMDSLKEALEILSGNSV